MIERNRLLQATPAPPTAEDKLEFGFHVDVLHRAVDAVQVKWNYLHRMLCECSEKPHGVIDLKPKLNENEMIDNN